MSDDVQPQQTPDTDTVPTTPPMSDPDAPSQEPMEPTPGSDMARPPETPGREAPPLPPIPPTPDPPPLPPIPETAPRPATTEWMFGADYVRQVLRWSIVLAAVGGVVGWLITAEIAFALAMWIGAAVDILTFRSVASRGAQAIEGGGSSLRPAGALALRLVLKGILLLIAVFLPWPAAFWGMLAGVLVVEVMIVVVGIVRSSATMFHVRGGTGTGAKP